MGGAQVKLGLTLEGSLWLFVCVSTCVCVHMCIHVCVKSSLCQVLTMQDLVEFSFFLIIVLLLTSFSDKETEAQ